jgi:hypothetical protein
VIVRDFDFESITIAPDEADPPLVIDADAVLAFPTSLQLFQPIARRHPEGPGATRRDAEEAASASPPAPAPEIAARPDPGTAFQYRATEKTGSRRDDTV